MKRKQKAAKLDYTRQMLPQTRKAVFFDVLRLQWRNLLGLSLILLLFSLPLLVSVLVRDVYSGSYLAALSGTEQASEPEAGYALAYFELIRRLVNIPLLMLFCVGLSGALRVLRQYAWEENVHLPTEFFKGIKSNCLQLLILGGLGGLIIALCVLVLFFSGAYSSGLLSAISLLPIAVSVFLILPIFAICAVMIPVYSNPLGANLKNARYVYSASPWSVLGTLAVCGLFFVPLMIPNLLCHVLGHLLFVLLLPVTCLGWTLFLYGKFDETINEALCPELVGKGLFTEQSIKNKNTTEE